MIRLEDVWRMWQMLDFAEIEMMCSASQRQLLGSEKWIRSSSGHQGNGAGSPSTSPHQASVWASGLHLSYPGTISCISRCIMVLFGLKLGRTIANFSSARAKSRSFIHHKWIHWLIYGEVWLKNTVFNHLLHTYIHTSIPYHTIPYDTIRYTTLHYTTLHYTTIHYNTIQYNTIQYNTIQYNTIQYIHYIQVYIYIIYMIYIYIWFV